MSKLHTDTPVSSPVTEVAPDLLRNWLDQGDTLLIDVREDVEHADERIDGALLHPLSRFDPDAIRSRHPEKRIVFHCRSGKRSLEAAKRFQRTGESVYHLLAGIEGWKSAGQHTIKSQSRRLPLMRQVQLVAGSLVTLGVLLGTLVDQWFLVIAGFVGVGLMFAGTSGWCGMAMLLAKMPWNRIKTPVRSCAT